MDQKETAQQPFAFSGEGATPDQPSPFSTPPPLPDEAEGKAASPAVSESAQAENSVFAAASPTPAEKKESIFGAAAPAPAKEEKSIFGAAPEVKETPVKEKEPVFGAAEPAPAKEEKSIFGAAPEAPVEGPKSMFGAPAPAKEGDSPFGAAAPTPPEEETPGAPEPPVEAKTMFGAPAPAEEPDSMFGAPKAAPEKEAEKSVFGAAPPATEKADEPVFGPAKPAAAEKKDKSVFAEAPPIPEEKEESAAPAGPPPLDAADASAVLAAASAPVSENAPASASSASAAPKKKKRKWVPIVIIAVVVFVVLPIIGIVAAIAIPTVMALKSDSDLMKVATEMAELSKNPAIAEMSEVPVALPQPAVVEVTETPAEPEPAPAPEPAPVEPVVAEPTPAPAPPVAEEKKVDLVGLNLPEDAPVWRTSGREDLRNFLSAMWGFDQLADHPFYDLSEVILTHNLDRPGQIDGSTEMALFVMRRKLDEFPQLGCAALTILSPGDQVELLSELNTQVSKLNNPFLSLQLRALQAERTADPARIEEALMTLRIALQSQQAEQLNDAAAFHVLGEKFLYNLPAAAPDRFLEIVQASSTVPRWLKDLKAGEIQLRKFHEDMRRQNYQPADQEAASKAMGDIVAVLNSAWEQNPQHPAAAAMLVELIGSQQEAELKDVRQWFDRAVEARADYAPAYSSYLKALSAKQTKNDPKGIEFGRNCAASGLNDSVIPMFLVDAHALHNANKGQSASEYWSGLPEEEWAEVERMFTSLNESPEFKSGRNTEKSVQALVWYLTGDKQRSAESLKNLEKDFDINALRAFKLNHVEELQFQDFLHENGVRA